MFTHAPPPPFVLLLLTHALRTKKEKEVVSNHSAYLETELNKALSDLATAKRNASNDIISLKGQLNDATNSNATLTLQAHDLKNSLATATLSATTYSSQLRTAATDGAATCAAYDTQILNLEGLNGQLKRSVQDMQGSVDEHRQSMQVSGRRRREALRTRSVLVCIAFSLCPHFVCLPFVHNVCPPPPLGAERERPLAVLSAGGSSLGRHRGSEGLPRVRRRPAEGNDRRAALLVHQHRPAPVPERGRHCGENHDGGAHVARGVRPHAGVRAGARDREGELELTAPLSPRPLFTLMCFSL